MVFVTMASAGQQTVTRTQLRLRNATFAALAALSGITAGIVLGAAGQRLLTPIGNSFAYGVSIAAICLGALELAGRAPGLLQRDRETPMRWLERPWRALARNAIAMGHGLSTRIGFWLWFCVPAAALMGGPTAGALVYGTYGLSRGLGPALILRADLVRRGRAVSTSRWILRQYGVAARLCAVSLLAIGVIALAGLVG